VGRESSKPEVSTSVKGCYRVLVVFIATFMVFFAYASLFTLMSSLGIMALIGTGGVETIMRLILRSFHKTRYILTEESFTLKPLS
jgi:hypothetical protein